MSQLSQYRGALVLVIPLVFFLFGARGLVWGWQQHKKGHTLAAREGVLVGLGLWALFPVAINPVVGLLPSLSIVGLMLVLARHAAPRWVKPLVSIGGVAILAVVSLAALSGMRPGTAMGPSMWPTSPKHMSLSWVDTHAYWGRQPRRGEAIEFAVMKDAGPDPDTSWPTGRYHKRIWAMPGDEIAIQRYGVWVNGKQVADCSDRSRPLPLQKWLCHVAIPSPSGVQEFDIVWGDPELWWYEAKQGKVPPGQAYVMGDNLPESGDSRDRGFIDLGWITGKAVHR